MALEPHGPDTFLGVTQPTPWGRVYGGQVVAQALRAASACLPTTDHPAGPLAVHSLHGYFMRGGELSEPIRYEVDRLRDGRSFSTRQVTARQSNGAIFTMSASFQRPEDGVDRPVAVLDTTVPAPDTVAHTETWTPMLERRAAVPAEDGRSATWIRLTTDLGTDPVLHACGLAYLSDEAPVEASRSLHPRSEPGRAEIFNDASLDHAVWFHRPIRADRWQLHDERSEGLVGVRGLTLGQVHAPDGTHAATVAQEVLVRLRR
jgi:acyl-CoA thioesterase-2